MSRLNTQDDRLVRGPTGFEAQRSFLTQPQRFAVGQGTRVDQVIAGIAQAAGTVTGIRENEQRRLDKIKAKTRDEEYANLIELETKAERDNSLIPELAERRQAARETYPEDARFSRIRTKEVAVEAFESRAVAAIVNSVRGMEDTFNPEDQTYLTNEIDSKNKITDAILTSMPEGMQSDIEGSDILQSQLKLSVNAIYNKKYAPLIEERRTAVKAQNYERDLTGAAAITLSGSITTEGLDTIVQNLSDLNGTTPQKTQRDVLNQAIVKTQTDYQDGRISVSQAVGQIENLTKYDNSLDFAASVAQQRAALTDEAIKTGRIRTSSAWSSVVASGIPPVNNANEDLTYEQALDDIYVSQLEQITGQDLPDDVRFADLELSGFALDVQAGMLNDYNSAYSSLAQTPETLRVPTNIQDYLDNTTISVFERGEAKILTDYASVVGADLTTLDGWATLGRQEEQNIRTAGFGPDAYAETAKYYFSAFQNGTAEVRSVAAGYISSLRREELAAYTQGMSTEDRAQFIELNKQLTTLSEGPLSVEELDRVGEAAIQARFSAGDPGTYQFTDAEATQISSGIKSEYGLQGVMSDTLKRGVGLYISAIPTDTPDRVKKGIDEFLSNNIVYQDPSTGVLRHAIRNSAHPMSDHSQSELNKDLNDLTPLDNYTTRQVTQQHGSGLRSYSITSTIKADPKPLLPQTIAEDLELGFTPDHISQVWSSLLLDSKDPAALMMKQVAQDRGVQLDSVDRVSELFRAPTTAPNYLRLYVDPSENDGFPQMFVRGQINGYPFAGDQSVFIGNWNPGWNSMIGRTEETEKQRLEELGIDGIKAAYDQLPNTSWYSRHVVNNTPDWLLKKILGVSAD